MVKTNNNPVTISGGKPSEAVNISRELAVSGREKTLSYRILRTHDSSSDPEKMRIKFDALISHDITYVGIIQTARASGMSEFPLPYVLTNCHNSLCAVGGTINEDDHAFGLSAAKKYGGIYVPANQAVIHQYAREYLAGCGKMVLGSDSHTRYGCYGTLGIGEGGGELAKQLLCNTYDIKAPEVVLVWIEGDVPHGIGPHDVAIALVGATFPSGMVKNKILEFAGPGVEKLSMDFRIGIDVMTTETSCLSSVWTTDSLVEDYYKDVGRQSDYKRLSLEEGAYYDSIVRINLSAMESMIAMPFHPSRAYTIRTLQENARDILKEVEDICTQTLGGQVKLDLSGSIDKNGLVCCEQGVIVGCAGGMYENIREAADILRGRSVGDGYFDLSVYPSSASVNLALTRDGTAAELIEAGAVIKPAFCGPCFGAGDTPANNTLSIRHATRNFPNREGSKPANGQISAVALMDARSVAATAMNGGIITSATDVEYTKTNKQYHFDSTVYDKRCYNGYGKAQKDAELKFGPNITDWPRMYELEDNLLIKLCAVIHDDVTTTDELIPSGETSSYRSNPIALSEHTLSRRAPEYVGRSKAVAALERERRRGVSPAELKEVLSSLNVSAENTTIGSCLFAKKPGDGSAREQAASCQKVLGGVANIAYEYATKRYRSNCINWGIVPFTIDSDLDFSYNVGDWIYVPGVRKALLEGIEEIQAFALTSDGRKEELTLRCQGLTSEEKVILTEGCLINYYAAQNNPKLSLKAF